MQDVEMQTTARIAEQRRYTENEKSMYCGVIGHYADRMWKW